MNALQRRVSQAGGTSLASIRAEVAATVAATQAVAQQASAASGARNSAEALHAASDAAHREVANFARDFYERKIFDPYLKFASAEDEDAYRKREAERQEAIRKAQAENTPESNLRAANLSIEQLKDAGAHGADRSPEFTTTLRGLEESKARLASQLNSADTKRDQMDRLAIGATAPTDDQPPHKLPPDLVTQLQKTGLTGRVPGRGVARW